MAAALVGAPLVSNAQVVRGHIVDEMGETVIGATVTVKGAELNAMSNIDGDFTLDVGGRGKTIVLTCVGYKPIELSVSGDKNFGEIIMKEEVAELNDVTVNSQIAVARKTPVAASTITTEFIEERLGTKEFPEVLKSTPGVHANKVGGGFGDSEIYMRGFDNSNIAVMINGVPMNDCESQTVYWSNWAGLSDVTRYMQTQRGLGASKVSAPSVGGTINIITKGLEAKRGGSFTYAHGNDGMNKIMFNVSSGMTKNGWAFTLLGARTWGNGYIQGTDYVAYNYFANISKRINDSHQLSLTVTGAPQDHYQRASKYGALTIQGWKNVEKVYGVKNYRYNPTYGFDQNGQRYSGDRNVYHKPQISLNHIWQIDDRSNLSTVLYCSIGRGYGYSGQGNGQAWTWRGKSGTSSYTDFRGASNGELLNTFRNNDGTFNYGAFQEINATCANGSAYIMTQSKNYHQWYGGISTYSIDFTPELSFYAGLDLRYYKGTHTNDIMDLMGGKYYIDNYRAQV
ncbi:MAG: carboxypeptidase-like regulatory domain-containing protein, partial [Bacteroidaceae bacterium]|nr:carboxypeptidase-like regulatory domain-containing protein [Bacteroidaceae bacterium]